MDSYDVVIIGAGAAGLAAAQDLIAADLRICCLEARDRIGGRILTGHDAATPLPIEFGAEFVHGKPSEIFDLAHASGLHIYETAGRPVSLVPDEEASEEDGWKILEDLNESATEENDETFQSFLDRSTYPPAQKQQAAAFVEGFNAARREVIGTASLAKDQRAGDQIEGDRTFRLREGYDTLIHALARGVEVRLNSVVEAVAWKPDAVALRVAAADPIHAHRVIITVPLGVLQAGVIRFDPEPAAALAAARALRFGDAFRVTFLFERAFWEDSPATANAGFLFSDEPVFPVWWTGLPLEPRAITGWCAGAKADALLGLSSHEVISRARDTLSSLLHSPMLPPHRAWFHDWHADPFARGAYSYVPAHALPARRTLAEPVADTLYFAGEATDLLGYGGVPCMVQSRAAAERRNRFWHPCSIVALFLALTLCSHAQNKPRARDLGVPFEGGSGPLNAITDVPGVEVGHRTLISGDSVRTGITAVWPRGKQSSDPVFGGFFSQNGNGDMTGTHWLTESGFLDGPVLITNTHSVGVVRDAFLAWLVKNHRLPGTNTFNGGFYTYPIVAETYDGFLNDINGFHVKPADVDSALDSAAPGRVAEGNVGGGTGMVCYGFKGGIGTASRKIAGGYTVGALVQCNCGARRQLRIGGLPVGAEIDVPQPRASLQQPYREDVGSIIIVVATDAPLLPHQTQRLARRATMGLARTGSTSGNGSGDIFIAFSTANASAAAAKAPVNVSMMPNDNLNPVFEGAVQAVEEAIVNAMVGAETMKGYQGNTVTALPHDKLREVLKKYNRLQ